jgi:hypothetical protein
MVWYDVQTMSRLAAVKSVLGTETHNKQMRNIMTLIFTTDQLTKIS